MQHISVIPYFKFPAEKICLRYAKCVPCLIDYHSTYHEHPQKVDQQKQQGLLGDDDDEDEEVDR